MTLQQLNAKWGLSDKVWFEAGNGGLPRVTLQSAHSIAQVYLHGAHVTSFRPHLAGKAAGHDLLWLSGKSWYEDGKPIRGGVPVCFPWFGMRASSPLNNGQPDQPGHGFVRLAQWDIESINTHSDGGITLTLAFRSSDFSRKWVPDDFEIRHIITVGSSLEMTLLVRNTGAKDFTFEEALHTYFAVGDIRQTQVHGLENRDFTGTPTGNAVQNSDKPIAFEAYTDSLYPNTDGVCVVEDAAMKRRIHIDRVNSRTTIVWNPWVKRAVEMPDFGDNEWPGMVCVETANARGQAITLGPGAQHLMRAIISQE